MAVDVGKFLLGKLKEFLLLLENFWGFLVKKFDEVLPPDTRDETFRHWLEVGLPVGLAALLLLLFLCCCCWPLLRACFSCCGSCLRSCGRCLCCCGRRSVKMMKAPGRDYMMPRHVFESGPRSYFIDLRTSSRQIQSNIYIYGGHDNNNNSC